MKRRDFVKAILGTGAAASGGGCLGLGGGDDEEEIGHRITDESGGGEFVMDRIDFVDQAGTLGQLDQVDNETDADDIVNEYTEDEWAQMDTNDLEVTRSTLQENDSSIEEIRPWVERALNRELEDNHIDTMDSPPGPEAPDERALIYGIGRGMNSESMISNSVDAANVLKPLVQKFASEYLDENLEAWITPATLPGTEGRFAHLPISMVYDFEGGKNVDYVEDAVPDTANLPEGGQAIRSAEDSVYSNPELLKYVTGFEYEKALEAVNEGYIEQEGRAHPVRAISTGMLAGMRNMVDSSMNDFNRSEIPPNGLVTHVSQEFGRSVEQAFDNLDDEKLQYMKNIGRGVQLFYEDKGGSANLAVGGTLEEPEFYEFPDEMKQKLWNFNYDSLSGLEG